MIFEPLKIIKERKAHLKIFYICGIINSTKLRGFTLKVNLFSTVDKL